MPYNISRRVVVRMKRYLDDLLYARRTITWPTRESDRLARRIREGLYAVRHHPEFSTYHDLKSWYTIHAREGFVEAEYLGQLEPPAPPSVLEPKTIEDIFDVAGVVGAAIKFAPESDELHFPNANLSYNDKLTLYVWTQKEGIWKFIDQEDAGLILTRKTVDPIFLWRPEIDEDHQ